MDERVREISALLEGILSLSPGQKKSLPKKLLTFLKVRQLPAFQDLPKSLESLVSDPRLKGQPRLYKIIQVLANESKIFALLVGLTKEEARELESYLKNLVPIKEDSLAMFLSKQLGGEISDRWDPDQFNNSRFKMMAVNMAVKVFDNEEDFQLKIKAPAPDETVFGLIRGFYDNKGYQLIRQMGDSYHNLALMFKKEKEILFVNISPDNPIFQITVDIND